MKQAVPWSRYLVFFAIAVGVCAADWPARVGCSPNPDNNGRIWWLWRNVFGFQTSLNPGALFGLGPGYWPLFAALSVAAAAAILVWLFVFGAARDWLLTVALGLVTAGILGNLYDRLALHGLGDGVLDGRPIHAVRDFIVMFQVGQWHWPNYNLADSALVSGVILLAWHALLVKPEAAEEMTNDENGMTKK